MLWNIGVAPGRLLIYRISTQGELQQVKCHAIRTSALVHDFAITDRYLLIWMAPLELLESRLQAGASPWEAMHWNPQGCSRLVVIERS